MEHNTEVAFAYLLLARGVHFSEVQRFVDAQPSADPNADTVPAPPPSQDGREDPTTVSTVPSPPFPRGMPASSLLDFRAQPAEFWDEVAELVERVG